MSTESTKFSLISSCTWYSSMGQWLGMGWGQLEFNALRRGPRLAVSIYFHQRVDMSFSLLTMAVISENLKQTFPPLSLSFCSDFSLSLPIHNQEITLLFLLNLLQPKIKNLKQFLGVLLLNINYALFVKRSLINESNNINRSFLCYMT